MKKISRITALLLIFVMTFAVKTGAVVDSNTLDKSIKATVNEIMTRKSSPAFNDEWSIIALARSGENIPQSYYDTYYKSVEEKVLAESKKKVPFTSNPDNDDWTAINDLERVIIALNAIGKNPQDVNGVNLINLIFNRENLKDENGVSGLTYALIAIDTKDYVEIPGAKNTRDSIIKDMLSLRTKDGGFSWDNEADTADLDTTAMAIQALYKYKDRSDVKEVIDTGIEILKKNQSETGDYVGSYMGWTYESPCTAAQVVVALDNLGMNPTDAKNGFVKTKDLIDVMMSYYIEGGGFKNASDEDEVNSMTTDQILYAFDSYKRLLEGDNTLYDMTEKKLPANTDTDEKKPAVPAEGEKVQEPEKTPAANDDKKADIKEPVIDNDKDEEKLSEEQNKDSNSEENIAKTGDSSAFTIILITILSGSIIFKSNLIKKVI